MDIVGIVVNPKLKKPVLVVWDGDEVEIWSLERDGGRIGMGGFENHDPQYMAPAYVTGLPRVHTPSGVSPKGKGYGTSLYTGLCLTAHQNSESELDLSLEYDGDGISSDSETRSASADQWWRQAVRLGLAEDIEQEHTEEDVEFSYGDLQGCEYDEGSVDINYARGDVTKLVSANAYHYSSAEKSDLIVASVTLETPDGSFSRRVKGEGKTIVHYLNSGALRQMWKDLVEGNGSVNDIDLDALFALDVRGLDPQAVNLLSTIASESDAKDEDIDALRMRAELNLDPSTPIKQMRLPFSANPSDERNIRRALTETEELRESLDWSRLSSLP